MCVNTARQPHVTVISPHAAPLHLSAPASALLPERASASAVDEACCNAYLHAPVVQNSFSLWQKNRVSLSFVEAPARLSYVFDLHTLIADVHVAPRPGR